jgi:hypothetical protein
VKTKEIAHPGGSAILDGEICSLMA